ncbi:MAG: NAD(+)/NADH kinase [Deltaproteobacteria bacterium]|nr:NAD(+)/NADH kinase [Deltaproteobacteria bacterium]
MTTVGIIANPASGKDIRRLVAYGSVFDNQEKVRIVRRLLLGLAALGVDRVCFLPDSFGIVPRALDQIQIPTTVFPADFRARGEQDDSTRAARIMEELGAGCILTLGGDGTNRVVAKGTTSVPVLPISTGTNNVFPVMIEATVAGVAAALVARGLVPLEESTFRSTKLEVLLDGKAVDLALVDAVVCDEAFVGSRAVWDLATVRQIVLNRADPGTIGFSSIGGLLHSIAPDAPEGLALELGTGGRPVTAPVAPGMVQTVHVVSCRVLKLGEEMVVRCLPSVIALDGEREVEVRAGQRAAIRVVEGGPLVVDVKRTMSAAAKRGVLAPAGAKTAPEPSALPEAMKKIVERSRSFGA